MKSLVKLIAKSAIGVGTFIGLGLLSAPVKAINITYTFDSSIGWGTKNSFSQVVNGLTGTFSEMNSGTIYRGFFADFNGILLNMPDIYGNQFDISFSKPVKFLSYTVTKFSSINVSEIAYFNLSKPNGTGSTKNNLANLGTFDFSNQFTLSASKTSTLTAIVSNPDFNTAYIKSITVEAVPWKTDALSVVGTTILFGLRFWAKRKSVKSLEK